MTKAYLVLANGAVFAGERCGATGDVIGEVVFTTGVCGYLETLSDPSYYGQIILQTFPLIGNYGLIHADLQGKPAAFGYVVRELCDAPSNFRSEADIESYLKENNIVGIKGIDTRAVTRILREEGVMNGMICSEPPADLGAVAAYRVQNALARVATGATEHFPSTGTQQIPVVLYDYGARGTLVQELTRRGCAVTVVPYDTPAETVLAMQPQGVVLGDGPGDPAENSAVAAEIKKLLGATPLFGVGLGHQLLALANGGAIDKLKYGHHGANQPVKDPAGGRTYITGQNHGYCVRAESLAEKARVTLINANDGTCEGLDYPQQRAFSIQFFPDAGDSDTGTSFLYDKFMQLIGGNN